MKKVQKIRQTQDGRSMVEMLGVLAIIGVLSIGGIAGYTMAMNRYKANQVLDLASKLSVMAQSGFAADPDNWNGITTDMFNELNMKEYYGYYGGGAYETTFEIDLEGDVDVMTFNNGIHNALKSITGLGGSVGDRLPVITVE